jgi:hypothetical protein
MTTGVDGIGGISGARDKSCGTVGGGWASFSAVCVVPLAPAIVPRRLHDDWNSAKKSAALRPIPPSYLAVLINENQRRREGSEFRR